MNDLLGSIPFFGTAATGSKTTGIDRRILPTLNDVLESGDTSRIIPYAMPTETVTIASPTTVSDQLAIGSVAHIRGTLQIGSQYHYYMEAQTAVCIPAEDGGLTIYPSTQWMDMVQIAISEALNMPQKSINIVVKRLGGSYGGKISGATHIACACALASHLNRRPVRFVMNLESNMSMLGKRLPCKGDYTVTVDNGHGKITALSNTFVEDVGYSANESLLFLTVHSFHNCYGEHPEWVITPNILVTDAPSNTWCRTPYHAEGHAMIENIMEHIAHEIGKDASEVRLANMQDNHPVKKLYTQFLQDVGESHAIYAVLGRSSHWK